MTRRILLAIIHLHANSICFSLRGRNYEEKKIGPRASGTPLSSSVLDLGFVSAIGQVFRAHSLPRNLSHSKTTYFRSVISWFWQFRARSLSGILQLYFPPQKCLRIPHRRCRDKTHVQSYPSFVACRFYLRLSASFVSITGGRPPLAAHPTVLPNSIVRPRHPPNSA